MIKQMKKVIISFLVMTLLLSGLDATINTSFVSTTAQAHSGRTDSSGGHKDNKNKSGLGSYHYHCGGYPAHLHKNGVCPYSTTSTYTTDSDDSDSIVITKTIIKKVQNVLNDLGYKCGKADGVMGNKTKKALKQYQEDYGLEVDGKIGKEVLESLGIDY